MHPRKKSKEKFEKKKTQQKAQLTTTKSNKQEATKFHYLF